MSEHEIKLPIPAKPEDGHQIVYWQLTSDGLLRCVLDYVKGPKSVHEVTKERMGDFYKGRGLPYVDEWSSHQSYWPSGDSSTGGRRIAHKDLRADPMVHGFLTFDGAKAALVEALKTAAANSMKSYERFRDLAIEISDIGEAGHPRKKR